MRKAHLLVAFCLSVGASATSYAQGEKREIPARDFFPRPEDFQKDARPVVYIELPPGDTLVLDDRDNAAYVLYGRALEIHVASVKVTGKVLIRAFPENFVPDPKGGAADKGDDGLTGGDGHGDGVGGEKGGRAKRGHTGVAGTNGLRAHKSILSVTNVVFASDDSSLTLNNQGQSGGKGQKGGKGGTGGRGGHGQDRHCGGPGPGNAGPRGAAGAGGTGGQGGTGGAAGDIVVSKALWTSKDKRIFLLSSGGKGGEAGDPGELGEVGQPGMAGAGSGACGNGGDGRHVDADPPDAYVPPPPSVNGADGKVSCSDCASQGQQAAPIKKPGAGKD